MSRQYTACKMRQNVCVPARKHVCVCIYIYTYMRNDEYERDDESVTTAVVGDDDDLRRQQPQTNMKLRRCSARPLHL